MLFERKIYSKFLEWKRECSGKKALLIEGARRIGNDMEIDFIISNNSKTKYRMFPIEVKSGSHYATASLERFREKYKARIGCCYIIHPRNLTVRDDIICIPPYMAICL